MKKIFKNFPLSAPIGLVAVLVLVVAVVLNLTGNNGAELVRQSTAENPGPTGVLVVDEETNNFSYVGEAGVSALASLKGLAEVVTDQYDFGEFVNSINGVAAESGVNFWAFYVNGAMATVGADSYIAEEGDLIEWRLDDIKF